MDDPVGEGHLADVDDVAAAQRVLDRHVLELLVEKPGGDKFQ